MYKKIDSFFNWTERTYQIKSLSKRTLQLPCNGHLRTLCQNKEVQMIS